MGKAGKSVLWFLGACLVFSQGIISAVAKIYATVDGGWVLLFGFLCLATVLGTLLLMYRQNPAFLTAERQDLVPLSLIQEVAKRNNPQLLTYLIRTLSPEVWTSGEVDVEEEQDTEETLRRNPPKRKLMKSMQMLIQTKSEFTKAFNKLKSFLIKQEISYGVS